MNESSAEMTATTTFVVHFWREWTGTESRWRGRVEHVQSGRQVSFLEFGHLLGFFERFGIGSEGPPAGKSEIIVSSASPESPQSYALVNLPPM